MNLISPDWTAAWAAGIKFKYVHWLRRSGQPQIISIILTLDPISVLMRNDVELMRRTFKGLTAADVSAPVPTGLQFVETGLSGTDVLSLRNFTLKPNQIQILQKDKIVLFLLLLLLLFRFQQLVHDGPSSCSDDDTWLSCYLPRLKEDSREERHFSIIPSYVLFSKKQQKTRCGTTFRFGWNIKNKPRLSSTVSYEFAPFKACY